MWVGLNILAVLVFIELVISLLVYVVSHGISHLKRKLFQTKVIVASYLSTLMRQLSCQ